MPKAYIRDGYACGIGIGIGIGIGLGAVRLWPRLETVHAVSRQYEIEPVTDPRVGQLLLSDSCRRTWQRRERQRSLCQWAQTYGNVRVRGQQQYCRDYGPTVRDRVPCPEDVPAS